MTDGNAVDRRSAPEQGGLNLATGTELLGRYRIVRPIGSGGMGTVYLAEDQTLGARVALKFLLRGVEGAERHLEFMRNEVRNARRVTHPYVCRVHDLGDWDGFTFISMELIEGEDLRSVLRRIGRVPPDKAVQIARQLCLGLFAAHHAGVLHRDLKPANVMLDAEGDVRITDFGISSRVELLDPDAPIVGTPAYMAPELIEGAPASVQSDLYSLGLVLYELFTGRRAHELGTVTQLMQTRRRPTVPPSHVAPGIPREVEDAILRCLAPEPALRPQSAMDVLALLPGGDPLSEVLASGQTPTPSVVAAAGGSGVLPWTRAAILLATIVAGGALVAVLERGVKVVDRERPPLSAEVLGDRAREHLRELGVPPSASIRASGFGPDDRTGALRFWYREAQDAARLRPADLKGRVRFDDPPVSGPGDVAARLTPEGALVEFLRVPDPRWPELAPDPVGSAPPYAAFGFASRAFAPTAPVLVPPVFADTHTAWLSARGPAESGATDGIRVEIASFRGHVVFARVLDAAPAPAAPAAAAASIAQASRFPWSTAANLLLIAAAAGIALVTLRRGRGDPIGALRIGAAAFVLVVLFTMLQGDARGTWGGVAELAFKGMSHGVAVGVLMALYYFALETHVRRIWPQSMIGWARLLDQRVADPLVGRDVLVGLALGIAATLVIMMRVMLPRVIGGNEVPLAVHGGVDEILAGVRPAVGVLFELVVDMAREAFKLFMTLVLFRLVLKNAGLAAAATVAVWMLVWGRPLDGEAAAWGVLVPWALSALLAWMFTLALQRFGLLTVVVAFVALGVAGTFPMRVDPAGPGTGVDLIAPLALGGVALLAFRAATRARRTA